MRQRLVPPAEHEHQVRVPVMDLGPIGVEQQRALKRRIGAAPVTVVEEAHLGEGEVGDGERAVERSGAPRGVAGREHGVGGTDALDDGALRSPPRRVRPRPGRSWSRGGSPPVEGGGVGGIGHSRPGNGVAGAEVDEVGVETRVGSGAAGWGRAPGARSAATTERSDLLLHRADVARGPLVRLGPEIEPLAHADQMNGDPEAVVVLAHAPFQHGGDVEPAADTRVDPRPGP